MGEQIVVALQSRLIPLLVGALLAVCLAVFGKENGCIGAAA
jgi:hypothetical protein